MTILKKSKLSFVLSNLFYLTVAPNLVLRPLPTSVSPRSSDLLWFPSVSPEKVRGPPWHGLGDEGEQAALGFLQGPRCCQGSSGGCQIQL